MNKKAKNPSSLKISPSTANFLKKLLEKLSKAWFWITWRNRAKWCLFIANIATLAEDLALSMNKSPFNTWFSPIKPSILIESTMIEISWIALKTFPIHLFLCCTEKNAKMYQSSIEAINLLQKCSKTSFKRAIPLKLWAKCSLKISSNLKGNWTLRSKKLNEHSVDYRLYKLLGRF